MRLFSRRVAAALLAGTAIAGLLAARSFVNFAPIRVRLLKASTAPTGGSVAVFPTEQSAISQLRTPFADRSVARARPAARRLRFLGRDGALRLCRDL